MRRANAAQAIRVAYVELSEERLHFLALVLEARVGRERANVARDRLPAGGVGTGHTTFFRCDPKSATWVRKEVELSWTSVSVGWDHPFPRTGVAPSGATREISARAHERESQEVEVVQRRAASLTREPELATTPHRAHQKFGHSEEIASRNPEHGERVA
jgi:hypothetical protein